MIPAHNLLFSGISCIVGALVKNNNSMYILQLVASLSVRFVAGISIKVVITMIAELFPTPIRSTVMGLGAIGHGIGGFLGLLIETLALIWDPLPLLVIGSFAILATLLCFFIPETKDEPLPETIEDAIKIGQKLK